MTDAVEGVDVPPNTAVKPRRRFLGTSAKPSSSKTPIRRVANQIPEDILHDAALNEAIRGLPRNYNFEIHKTIHQIRREGVKVVALQMPEGLMMYGTAIADIIERFTGALPLLLADVTYGACCIDDYTAREMGAEMIVHYGHSCLIPVNQTSIKTLYIFVEIAIDTEHLSLSMRRNFPSSRAAFRRSVLLAGVAETGSKVSISIEPPDSGKSPPRAPEQAENEPTRLALVSTIQFVAAVQALREDLEQPLPPLEVEDVETDDGGMLSKIRKSDAGVWRGRYQVTVPQVKPLSPGEVLGCTAPKLPDVDALIYVGDGRFHLESIMIANPSVPAFRFDPYSRKFTRETYEHAEMREARSQAVRAARRGLAEKGSESWAVILGTLGRQGSLSVLKTVQSSLPAERPPVLICLSELSPAKLALFPESQITAFVQTACPRLSIDWGYAFSRPLLSTYEASVAIGHIKGWAGVEVDPFEKGDGDYAMDFYADHSLGPWTPRHQPVVSAR